MLANFCIDALSMWLHFCRVSPDLPEVYDISMRSAHQNPADGDLMTMFKVLISRSDHLFSLALSPKLHMLLKLIP